MIVKKLALLAPIAAFVLASHAFAQSNEAVLEKFKAAYTAGKGLTYVVVSDGKQDRVYRYGDASREAAKKDSRGFMLFTCTHPKVMVSDSVSDRELLAKARVVQAGEPEFAALDARYLKGCRNPLVKSAIPKN